MPQLQITNLNNPNTNSNTTCKLTIATQRVLFQYHLELTMAPKAINIITVGDIITVGEAQHFASVTEMVSIFSADTGSK